MEDIKVDSCGTIAVLTALTPAGLAWLQEHTTTESWQWNGPSLTVDSRYAAAISEGAENAGLTLDI